MAIPLKEGTAKGCLSRPSTELGYQHSVKTFCVKMSEAGEEAGEARSKQQATIKATTSITGHVSDSLSDSLFPIRDPVYMLGDYRAIFPTRFRFLDEPRFSLPDFSGFA